MARSLFRKILISFIVFSLITPPHLLLAETFDDLDQYFEDYFEEDLADKTPPANDTAPEQAAKKESQPVLPKPEPQKAEKELIPAYEREYQSFDALENEITSLVGSAAEEEKTGEDVFSEIAEQTETEESSAEENYFESYETEEKPVSSEREQSDKKPEVSNEDLVEAIQGKSENLIRTDRKPLQVTPEEEQAFEAVMQSQNQRKKEQEPPQSIPQESEEAEIDYVDVGSSYLDGADIDGMDFQGLLVKQKQVDREGVIDQFVTYLIGEEVEPQVIRIDGNFSGSSEVQFKTLEQAIQEATANHLPIEIAREKVSLYRRKINKSLRDLFPAMTLSAMRQDRTTGGAPDEATETYDYKASIRQPIYQGGALWNKVREDKANLKASMAEYHKIFSDLSLEVATAYFNLAKAKTMKKYREDLLLKANDSLVLSEEKYDANLSSEIENLNVQSQQSQINTSLQQSKEEIELALLEVQKAMNLDLDVTIDVYDLDDFFEMLGGMDALNGEAINGEKKEENNEEESRINQLIHMAYDNRPEFVIGENKVRARKYAEKAQKGAWLPQANLFAEVGRNREGLIIFDEGAGSQPWEDFARVGVDFSWNVMGNTARFAWEMDEKAPRRTGFRSGGKGDTARTHTVALGVLDNLEQYSKVKELEVATKEAILEFELSEKDMVSEVKESYYNFNRAKIQMRSVLKKIKYRQKLVELAEHRSEINEIQVSEYLQSEIDLVEERNTFFQAMVDFFVARASLNKAVGISNFLDVEGIPHELLI